MPKINNTADAGLVTEVSAEAQDSRPEWTMPMITSFAAVMDARGVMFLSGDGISNLS